MNNVIPFRPRSSDHVVIERLTVREGGGSLVTKYFVSSVFDGGRSFGDFDSENYSEARGAAAECDLPIVDLTGALQ